MSTPALTDRPAAGPNNTAAGPNAAGPGPATGPTTPAGRAVSARNATTHGLFARDVVLPALGEDPAAFDALLELLCKQLPPRNLLERHYLEQIAAASWRLRRLHRWQAQVYEDPALGEDARLDRLDRTLRHEVTLSRQIDHAVRTLNRDLKWLFEGRARDEAFYQRDLTPAEVRAEPELEIEVQRDIWRRLRPMPAPDLAGLSLDSDAAPEDSGPAGVSQKCGNEPSPPAPAAPVVVWPAPAPNSCAGPPPVPYPQPPVPYPQPPVPYPQPPLPPMAMSADAPMAMSAAAAALAAPAAAPVAGKCGNEPTAPVPLTAPLAPPAALKHGNCENETPPPGPEAPATPSPPGTSRTPTDTGTPPRRGEGPGERPPAPTAQKCENGPPPSPVPPAPAAPPPPGPTRTPTDTGTPPRYARCRGSASRDGEGPGERPPPLTREQMRALTPRQMRDDPEAEIAYRKHEQALYLKYHPGTPAIDWDDDEIREAYGAPRRGPAP